VSAEDTVALVVEGKAQGTGSNVRTQALDVAFADAVTKVVREILPAPAREKFKDTLRDNVIRRSRLYVAKFKVLDERSVEGQVHLQAEVTVDRDKLRAALAELGVAETVEPGGGSRPRVVVLLKATSGSQTVTTFGSTGGDGGAAGRAVLDELRAHGFDVVDTAGRTVQLSGAGDDGLPIDDDAAVDLARSVGAGGAFVVGVGAKLEGKIRGTSLTGAAATASLRVVDAQNGEAIAKSSGKGAAWGNDDGSAAGAAAVDSVERAMRSVAADVARHWPVSRSSSGDGLEVKIRGASSWAVIAAIIAKLAATRGVRAVHPIRVDRGKIDIALESGISPNEVAAQIKRARVGNVTVATKVKDRDVLVKITGSATGTVTPTP
jgi:hypothetical protein